MDQKINTYGDKRVPEEAIGKLEPKPSMKEKLTRLFSFSDKDETTDVPPPGTPPTFDEEGSVIDPGNPFIGPIDPKLGYAPVGYSGAQLRMIRRAQQRREAAQRRVAKRNHNRGRRLAWQHDMDNTQRAAILDYEIPVSPALYENARRDQARIDRLPTDEQIAAKRVSDVDRRQAQLDFRRSARFQAGQPRGKDLREETYNEYEHLLPTSARNRAKIAEGR